MNDLRLQTIFRQRAPRESSTTLAAALTPLMKTQIGRRVKQLGALAKLWEELVPQELRDHTALDSFRSGTLVVLVDSASAMYRIKTMVSGGLEAAMRERFTGAKFRIRLRPGQFYRVDSEGRQRFEF
ncbi:MAG: DUF721 domain-containing protein [Phycisphaerales bacterium]|jgi:hypothetical protein|nr:DUF721 domain-containing protein [Phycisphaerales bacterium]MBT7171363.1 DUF721 domain-containing protein [Phycisphaerales bacterium]